MNIGSINFPNTALAPFTPTQLGYIYTPSYTGSGAFSSGVSKTFGTQTINTVGVYSVVGTGRFVAGSASTVTNMYILLDVSGTYFARNQPLGGTISAPINQEFNINVAGIIQISAVPT